MTPKPNAYPEPPPFNWDIDAVEIRDVLPVYPPPEPLSRPELPSPAREPEFNSTWTLTTHLIPACYLRTTRFTPEPEIPPPTVPKDERKRLLVKARLELDELRTSKVTDGYPRVLWNCVNRYVRKDLDAHNRTGLTLSFQHANGFAKEVSIVIILTKLNFIFVRYLSLHWPTCSRHLQPTSLMKCGSGNPCSMATRHSSTRVLFPVSVSRKLISYLCK